MVRGKAAAGDRKVRVRFASLACSDGSSIISEVFDVPSETLMIEVFGPLMVAFLLLMAAFGIRRLLHQFRNRMTPEQRQAARDSFRRRASPPQSLRGGARNGCPFAAAPSHALQRPPDHSRRRTRNTSSEPRRHVLRRMD